MRATCLALAALSFAVTAGCTPFQTFRASKEIHRELDGVEGMTLDIKSRNGSIEIIVDPDVARAMIDGTLTCTGDSQSEADQRLAASSINVALGTDRVLTIHPVFPDKPRGSDGLQIVVRVPNAASINADSGNGALKVFGGSGELVLDTSNGRIEITDFDGNIRADTSNGRIVARGVTGAAHLDSSNGKIILELADDCSAPFHASTSNGAVTVVVGPGFTGTVVADTSNGGIDIIDPMNHITEVDRSRNHARAVIGSGGENSIIDTSNGRVQIEVRGAGASAGK